MDCIRRYTSPLGGITLLSDGEALTGLWFDGQKHFPAALGHERTEKPLPVFEEAVKWLDLYFSGKDPGSTPKLSLCSTPFREAVWETLQSIPYGKTMTYGEIAARLAGKRGAGTVSARAVGGAVGRNPISLIIPCHRVVGANGRLTGYAAGVDKKRFLLSLEGVRL